ncbi:hypothetical protein [Deinococcus aerius]|nr:hypothetical protein [Deinococcus aerius]
MRPGLLTVPLGLLALHFVLMLGLERRVPWGERLASYPAALSGLFNPEVLGQTLPLAGLTAAYLAGGLALAWILAALLSRAPRPLLWLLESLPPYLLLVGGVGAALALTLARGWNFPLEAWSPVMLALIAASLALPLAARSALLTRQVREEALAAEHTRVARAMGLAERTVQRRAARLALPERAAGLAGDALGLTLSLAIIEGLLQFPGVGNEAYLAWQGTFAPTIAPGAEAPVADAAFRLQITSASLLLLLGLGLLAAAGLHALARRLDPRPRAGEEAR